MPPPRTLSRWLRQLLPGAGVCAQHAARDLLRALLVTFTTDLCQLARQLPRDTTAKSGRQFLARWLERSHWETEAIYADLNREARRVLTRRGTVPLLVDFTHLQDRWTMLQISMAWQGRALPLYRLVYPSTAPAVGQKEQVRTALAFLRRHLPEPAGRYVVVMDRGFPSHLLVRELQAGGWRFVLRVSREWKLTHPEAVGQLKELAARPGWVGPRPRCLADAVWGDRNKGRASWSRAHLVSYHGRGHREPWFLVTSERRAGRAVAWYRERMRIECEFRDLKGPWGLDELARWQSRERVARFLALVAVYEWYLVRLWQKHRLARWAPMITVTGKLSWIRVTREWIQRQLRSTTNLTLDFL
jgi:Transposase DDE domain